MKRKELLLKIDWIIGVHKELPPSVNDSLKALRAVVELHKVSDVGLFCDGCARFVEPYPCPTIEAIEKELV